MAENLSNAVPFQVIEDEEVAPRYGVEVAVYSYLNPNNIVDVVPFRMEPKTLDEIQGPGGGSMRVMRDDEKLVESPNLLDYRNVCKLMLDGKAVGAFLLQNKKSEFLSPKEKSGEYWEASGEGLRSWFRDATVQPYRGLKTDSQDTRVFSFASERGDWYKPSQWLNNVRIQKHNLDPNPGPFGTAPAEWPDAPEAWWIWGVANNGKTNPAPEGLNYFRYEFNIATGVGKAKYSFFAAAKDKFDVYIDGQRIIEAYDDDAYSQTWRADFELSPGDHVLAARARSEGSGAAGFIGAFFRAGDASAETPAILLNVTGVTDMLGLWNARIAAAPADEKALVTSQRNAFVAAGTYNGRWSVNAYPDPAPGWSPGEIMLRLLEEAEARGVRFPAWLTPTFTSEVDSSGEAWPRALDWGFRIGTEYIDVINKLEELVCDVWIDPDNYDFNMYVTRGTNRNVQSRAVQPVKFEAGRNVIRAKEDGKSEIKNTLTMDTEDGWQSISDSSTNSLAKYGVIEGYVSTGASSSVSADVASRVFDTKATPETSATYELIDVDDARPFRDFFPGDWVLAPSPDDDSVLVSRRVMSIAVSENSDTGAAEYAIEFDTIFQDVVSRYDRWLKAAGDGTMGGTLANVSIGGGSGSGSSTVQNVKKGPQGLQGLRGFPGFHYRGEWASGIEYYVSDVVYYNNRFWVASATTSETPSDAATGWDELKVGLEVAPTASISLGRAATMTLPVAMTTIPWTVERFKSVLGHATNSEKVVITSAGPYLIMGEFRTTISSSGTRDFSIYINGSLLTTVKTVRSSESATIGTAKIPGLLVPLALGDEIEIRSTGNASHTLEFANNATWLSIFGTSGTMGPEGPPGNTGPAGTITSATAVGLAPGASPTVTLGGTPSSRTMEFGIPAGEQGEDGPAGTITSATAVALPTGDDPTITLGGTPEARTLEFGIPTAPAPPNARDWIRLGSGLDFKPVDPGSWEPIPWGLSGSNGITFTSPDTIEFTRTGEYVYLGWIYVLYDTGEEPPRFRVDGIEFSAIPVSEGATRTFGIAYLSPGIVTRSASSFSYVEIFPNSSDVWVRERSWSVFSALGNAGPDGDPGPPGPPGDPLRFVGSWDISATYYPSDVVEFGGSLWTTPEENHDQIPGGPGSPWVEISVTGGGGGTGVPPGGLTGQVLTKLSDTDGDADWEDIIGPSKFETAGDLGGTQTGSNYTSVKWSIRPSTRVKLRALRLPATGYSAGTIQVYLDGGLVGSTVYGGSGSPSVSTDVVLDARVYEVEVRHSAGSRFTVTAAGAPRTYWTSFCSLQVGEWTAFPGYLVMAQYDLEGAGDPLVPSRSFASVATASIAAGTQELTSISMSRGYRVIALKTDRPARVRIYATSAQQAADAARPVGTDPTGNHGLLLEYVTTSGMLEAVLSPMVDGASMETTPSNNIPVTVTNLSGSASTVQVDLTYMRTE